MLVLTRKQNEKIRIGDGITITVVRTKGKTVRLGIQAPSSMRVLRGEIAGDIGSDNAFAACSPPANDDQGLQAAALDRATRRADRTECVQATPTLAVQRADRRQTCRTPLEREAPKLAGSLNLKARERTI